MKKTIISIFVVAAILLTAAFLTGKTVEIDTPYLIGDEITVYDLDAKPRSGKVTGICVDQDTIFYQVKTDFATYYLTLKQVQEMQPSTQVSG